MNILEYGSQDDVVGIFGIGIMYWTELKDGVFSIKDNVFDKYEVEIGCIRSNY